MKTRDLFAGCSVTIATHDDVWLVSLVADSLKMVTMRTYHELSEAIEVVHEWSLMLTDDEELSGEDVVSMEFEVLQETIARSALGEEMRPRKTVEETVERDGQRKWFEREMDKSRNEEE